MIAPNRRLFAFAALASLAICGLGARPAHAEALAPAASSDDADATGQVWTQIREEGDRLVVSVANVAPSRSLLAVVLDADGDEAPLGVRLATPDGHAFWSIDTAFGAVLPFGAESVADLVDYDVVVRDATDATVELLAGTLPDPAILIVDQDGREGIPRAGAPVGSEAHVRVAHRTGTHARELIAVDVAGLEGDTTASVWLEQPGSPGLFVNAGLVAVAADGTGRFEVSTADGAPLPFGVARVSFLAGLHVQVRDPAGLVLFAGLVPAPL